MLKAKVKKIIEMLKECLQGNSINNAKRIMHFLKYKKRNGGDLHNFLKINADCEEIIILVKDNKRRSSASYYSWNVNDSASIWKSPPLFLLTIQDRMFFRHCRTLKDSLRLVKVRLSDPQHR